MPRTPEKLVDEYIQDNRLVIGASARENLIHEIYMDRLTFYGNFQETIMEEEEKTILMQRKIKWRELLQTLNESFRKQIEGGK